MRTRAGVLPVLFLLLTSLAFASSPFGIEIGMTVEEMEQEYMYPEEVPGSPGYYWVYPPYPAEIFIDYIVKVSDTYGVYIVQAYTDDIYTDEDGWDILDVFFALEEEMDYSFGEGERFGTTEWGSDIFMYEMMDEDAYFYTEWYPEYGNYIAEDIIDAALILLVTDLKNWGFIELEYLADTYWDADF